jgi:hypothetical protein
MFRKRTLLKESLWKSQFVGIKPNEIALKNGMGII